MTPPSRTAGIFNTTVDAVYALCPEAERVTDANDSRLPTPITEETIAGWIGDLTSILTSELPDYSTLPELVQLGIGAAARGVIANGTASYFEAALHPDTDSPYAAVLWERYTTGSRSLVSRVADMLGVPDPNDGGGPGGGVVVLKESPPFGVFPDPYFEDEVAW